MKRSNWRPRLAGRLDPHLRTWLTEPASLTARCQRGCDHFRVNLLAQGHDRSLADDGVRTLMLVREVALECDGEPVIFAHTTLSMAPNGRLNGWLARLGTRALGSLLFSFPGFRRGSLEYRRLDSRHPLYRRAAALGTVGKHLWARRSCHYLDGQQVLVTEVFLPGIDRLP